MPCWLVYCHARIQDFPGLSSKGIFMKTSHLVASILSLVIMVLPSCSKLQPEWERTPELYTSLFDLVYKDFPSGTGSKYLVPVVHNSISQEEVLKKVKGQGWKTTALYRLDTDKKVVKEYILVTEGVYSTARNERSSSYLTFSDDGQSVSFYEFYGESDGRYETDSFTYDGLDNTIILPTYFGSHGTNGRLVYLSSDTMVLVCTHDKDYNQDEIIYMEVLQRVSAAERKSWAKRCTHYGIRM